MGQRGRHLQVVGKNTARALPLDPDRDLWERQPRESDPAWEAFRIYRDLGVGRSISQVCEVVSKSRPLLTRWSAQWSWVRRAAEWDRHVDRKRQERVAQEQIEMGERHARQAQAYLQALMQPAVAVLEKVRDDPDFFRRMLEDPRTAPRILELLARYASVMPSVANVERLARGEPTTIERVERETDGREVVRDVIDDPETAALAQQLYERVARVG